MQNDLFKPAASAETRDSKTGSDEAVSCKELLGITSNSEQPSKKKSKAWDYHRQPDGKDEWLTPPELIWSLSESFNGEKFDLDPCSPIQRPWDTAKTHYSTQDNGLIKPWTGRAWCNPPYKGIDDWVNRSIEHHNAILLTFSRTETKFWQRIWETADAILFLYGRLTFYEFVCAKCGATISQHKPDKTPCVFENSGKAEKAQWTGGAGSALIAFGDCNVDALEHANQECEIAGKLIYPRRMCCDPS